MRPTTYVSLAIVAASASLPAQVYRVPSPSYPTITAALAAALPSTTILVAAGTYTEVLTWPAVDGIRLISESGPAVTKINANQLGRPMTFTSTAVTRKTLIEGFEITGGLMMSSNNRNYGAGIHLSGSSPTFRNNKISGNVSDGPNWNYGGGFYITSNANPLIIGNVIEGNELRNGSWNYGAGIYVESNGSADIVGNTIRGNKNRSPASTSGNRGHGAGIYAGGATVLIASNLIVDNENVVTSWNYGAGIVANMVGNVTVVNNTIAGNKCTGGNWVYGGGLYATGSSGTLVVAGNIFSGNSASGATSLGAGGLHASSLTATVTLDWNDFWQSTGANYVGITGGPNDMAVDPKFASTTSYDLASTSPLIDKMPATWLPATVGVDYRGGSRRSDGNLDGLAGNGAKLDIGAAEFCGSALTLTGALKLGTVPTLQITAAQPSLYLVLLDVAEGSYLIDPVGMLLLSPLAIPLVNGATPGSVFLPVPINPALAGLTVWLQAATVPLGNPFVGATTNAVHGTIY